MNDVMSTVNRERLRAKTSESQQHWKTYKQCECICVKQMDKVIKPVYYTELNYHNKGLKGINIRTFLNLILDR